MCISWLTQNAGMAMGIPISLMKTVIQPSITNVYRYTSISSIHPPQNYSKHLLYRIQKYNWTKVVSHTSRLSNSYSRKSNSRMYMPNFCSVSVVSCWFVLSDMVSLFPDTSSVEDAMEDWRSKISDVWLNMT